MAYFDQHPRKTNKRELLLIALVVLLTGCNKLGPQAIEGGRNQYNAAINQTEMEQLLLNIVRFRFTDNPYFLKISSISSTVESEASFGGSEDKGVLGSLKYKEKPTLIYSPLGGKAFVRQLLNRIDLKKLYLMAGAGWEVDDILRIFTNSINGIKNAPSAVGPSPEEAQEFKKFLQIAELFDYLDDTRGIIIAPPADQEDGMNELIVSLDKESLSSPKTIELIHLLGLNPEGTSFRMKIGLSNGSHHDNEIIIETRPMMGAMFFISQGVEVPEEILKNKEVHINRPDGKKAYDWHPMLDQLFRVKSSASRPDDPYLAVRYKDYWFYIDNTDTDSKETMVLVSIMFQLQAGGGESEGPVLTLPVGGI